MPFDAAPIAACIRFNCTVCPAASACLISGATPAEMSAWSAALESQVSLPYAGKVLIEAGSRADAIYTVRAGCLKSCTIDAEGNERVRGFHLPGDIIGLDALGADVNPARVVAVVPSQVCRIPRAAAMELLARAPALVQRLLERTSRDLASALSAAGDYTADQRVAAFLVTIISRLGARGSVRLPMPRRDIASYLRLATETVCRVLTRFQAKGWLLCEDKTVRLLHPQALSALAVAVGLPQPLPLAA